MVEGTDPTGLPPLSSLAWAASLVAALLALALGVYPFVAYPAVERLIPGTSASWAPALVSRASALTFAGIAAMTLLLAFTGDRRPIQRTRLVYASLGAAVIGAGLLIVGLRALRG